MVMMMMMILHVSWVSTIYRQKKGRNEITVTEPTHVLRVDG